MFFDSRRNGILLYLADSCTVSKHSYHRSLSLIKFTISPLRLSEYNVSRTNYFYREQHTKYCSMRQLVSTLIDASNSDDVFLFSHLFHKIIWDCALWRPGECARTPPESRFENLARPWMQQFHIVKSQSAC